MNEASGGQWCERYPTSVSLDDLIDPFRTRAKGFLASLESVFATVKVTATYRPVERAYLMHWAWAIYRGLPANMCPSGVTANTPISPDDVPPMAGVGIDWTCGKNLVEAKIQARNMCVRYGMAYAAALTSEHTKRLAFDADISWNGTLNVAGRQIKTTSDLWAYGASLGVFKLISDPPHWSANGH